MSNETFTVGEIAIAFGSAHGHDALNGSQCTILGLPRPERWSVRDCRTIEPGWYLIEIGERWFQCRPHQLRKLRPPRDDLQAADPAHVPFWNLISKVPA
jgi:hypothetical protein